MGFFDSLRHSFNPQIQETFDYLYNNYYKGLKSFCESTGGSYGGYTFHRIILSRSMPYANMKSIYESKDHIIRLHNLIIEGEKIESDKKEVEQLASKYPHAFYSLCRKYLGGVIRNPNLRMPGTKKSSRRQREERENRSRTSFIGINSFINADMPLGGYIPSRLSRSKYQNNPTSVDELVYEDVKTLLQHKSEFASEEKRILGILEREDIEYKFDEEVLDIKWRAEWYEKFLVANNRPKTDKKYVVENLDALSKFRTNEINQEYLRVKQRYPKGVEIFERDFSKDKERIIQNVERIVKFQENADKYNAFVKWEKEQNDYKVFTRSINPSGFGCYIYDVPFETIKADGTSKKSEYKVWQHFCEAFYSSDDVADMDTYVPYLRENAKKVICLFGKTINYYDSIYDKIFSFIKKIKEKYGSVTVVWGTSSYRDYIDINNFHFRYLRSLLNENNISNVNFNELSFPGLSNNLVVIDITTTNTWLQSFCSNIIKENQKLKPLITYISLCKGYDKSEVSDIISEKKRKEEEERRKKEEEIRIKDKALVLVTSYPEAIKHFFPSFNVYNLSMDEYRQIVNKESTIKNRAAQIQRIKVALQNLDSVKGIPYYYFYHYYPTRFTDVSKESEKARKLIWNFKDGIATAPSIASLVSEKLKQMFTNEDLSQFTLVCIPASSREVNEERYSDFTKTVCNNTGMANGFTKIQITKEKTPAHLSPTHETEPAEYSIDSTFFDGAKVILFDDVVTKGRSMAQFKNLLEEKGAEVICAISIGRTYSDYFGDNRKPHPYSGLL